MAIIVVIGAIFIELLRHSAPAFEEFGLNFIVDDEWDPVSQRFGAASSIFGTLVSTAIAMILAVPLALVIALFLVELAPAVPEPHRRGGHRAAGGHP